MDTLRKIIKSIIMYIRRFIKLTGVALLMGLICGLVGFAFYFTVGHATELRLAHPWLIYLLPVGGVLIALIYRATQMEGKGTDVILSSIQNGHHVPILLVPAIFLATTITHFCGGSAGREGAALQIGGGIGCQVGNLLKLDEKAMRMIILCGMSSVFAALFGTPLTASVFALEVISVGIFHYGAFLPCIVSSLTAYGVSLFLGLKPTRYAVVAEAVSVSMILRVAVLAIICAAVSICFCEGMHHVAKRMKLAFKSPIIRALVGGIIVLVFTLVIGNQNYNGSGDILIEQAMEFGTTPTVGFIFKILITAISIGCGFKGGEIVPSFFVGASLGCTFGPLLGISPQFAAAIGLIAMFCGSFNTPLASIILSVEIFGADGIIYFALACAISYVLSGYSGIYETQKIVYSKFKTEFIDRKVKDKPPVE